jgi:hypothetical protein
MRGEKLGALNSQDKKAKDRSLNFQRSSHNPCPFLQLLLLFGLHQILLLNSLLLPSLLDHFLSDLILWDYSLLYSVY